MIERITKKEYKSLKDLERRCGSGVLDCIIFEGIDGLVYKCRTKGAAGMKEVWQYQRKLKKQKNDRLQLLEIESMLQ